MTTRGAAKVIRLFAAPLPCTGTHSEPFILVPPMPGSIDQTPQNTMQPRNGKARSDNASRRTCFRRTSPSQYHR